ncbi:WhiB family transcriptional regulator [Streptomyces pimonensis]|uniref:Transcriptional regulator WhiB n=1 Tax=Streptomyces pimonensis TaxID=2860288 RepID=A0ABV4J0E4_9ACTN
MTADWRHHAACSSENTPDIFFPKTETGTYSQPLIAAAKAVCARCPVTHHCLQWALENRITDGIWGGLTETERRSRPRTQRHH